MQVSRLVRDYDDATQEFLAAVNRVTPSVLDRRRGEAWSARHIIRHLTDAQVQGYVRLTRLLAEPGSLIVGYDDDAWMREPRLGYDDQPLADTVALFCALRQGTLDVLSHVNDQDLERYVEHSELGRYTLRTWFENYTSHPREHAQWLVAAITP